MTRISRRHIYWNCGGDEMKRKLCPIGLLLIGLSAGIIVSILIPDTLIVFVLAVALLAAGILILR